MYRVFETKTKATGNSMNTKQVALIENASLKLRLQVHT